MSDIFIVNNHNNHNNHNNNNNNNNIIGQGNNSYIFPGVGLGVVVSGSTRVTDKDMLIAAKALASCLTDARLSTGCLYPDLAEIRNVSSIVAAAIATAAWDNGKATVPRPDDILSYCKSQMYKPTYDNCNHYV